MFPLNQYFQLLKKFSKVRTEVERWERCTFAGLKFDCGLRKESHTVTVSTVATAEGKKLQK